MPKDATQKSIYTTLYTKSALKRLKTQMVTINDKCKSYIELIDPFDDEYSEIISDTQIDTLKIFDLVHCNRLLLNVDPLSHQL